MLQDSQTEESPSHKPGFDPEPAPSASCACGTYSEPRTIEGLTFIHVSTLAGVPGVSLEHAPRGNIVERTPTLGHGSTHDPQNQANKESNFAPTTPTRRGSFAVSDQSDAGSPGCSQYWSTDAASPAAVYDSDVTTESSIVNVGSQYIEPASLGYVTPQSDSFDHDYRTVAGAHPSSGPEYAQDLVSHNETVTMRLAQLA
jgi:hypothetical protein